ncbi:siderophore ABC transporter substrate-binding protein [Antarcticirhabdus aurantiaca]|uniref:Siderophore ABC transporter substrate-binding protein n=1 Tax=Antarcticirhabdus aurantiaca TaxID=2606717 RepID=A0ACD4NNY2_9HYPH|nr:siderophore ABC transporter substrate-binding protein [Antarcticirhabdus aurantiaca]WAJ28468.1 siderophore ABC transporter substrate-binding protein [Jeongeuplla avenae]
MSIETASGTVAIPRTPKTVVVFDTASLDTLDALGIRAAGVPQARLPDYVDAHASAEKVGSLQEPDLEAVGALEPDLIIVGGRSRSQAEALSAIAQTIDLSIDNDAFLANVETRARDLGKVFNKEVEAEALVTKLKASIADLKTETGGVERGLIVLTTGNKMSAYGPGSRFGMLHTDYGIKAARDDLDTATHGEAISFEFIAEANPDWLFVVDRDAAIGRGAAASMLDNALVGRTDAWKNGRVVYLDPAGWYLMGGGIQAVQRNVEQLREAFADKG